MNQDHQDGRRFWDVLFERVQRFGSKHPFIFLVIVAGLFAVTIQLTPFLSDPDRSLASKLGAIAGQWIAYSLAFSIGFALSKRIARKRHERRGFLCAIRFPEVPHKFLRFRWTSGEVYLGEKALGFQKRNGYGVVRGERRDYFLLSRLPSRKRDRWDWWEFEIGWSIRTFQTDKGVLEVAADKDVLEALDSLL